MQEVFKDIPGFNGLYQVSDLGRVKSFVQYKEGKILTTKPCNNNYPRACLNHKFYNIHQLIAITFMGFTPEKGLVVDHIDDNRSNSVLSNLQILTHRQNLSKTKKGKSKYVGVCYDKWNKGWKAAIQIDGKIKNLGKFKCETKAYIVYQNKLKQITNG